MQRQIYAITSALVLCCAGCAESTAPAELSAELLEMGRLDQDVRERAIAVIRNSGSGALDTEQWRALVDEQNRIDEANFVRLEQMVSERGWPSAELVGDEASNAAWLILEHADIERQKQYLSILRDEVAQGRASASKLAGLEDEVALTDSGQQIYGTEISVDLITREATLEPVRDPGGLDARRASIGLPPIEEYLREVEAQLGMPVDRNTLVVE